MLIYENTTYCKTVSCILIWKFGQFLFGNLANFYLGIWPIFIWEFGRFSFGNLADFYLGTWRKIVRRVGGFPFGELAGGAHLISAIS